MFAGLGRNIYAYGCAHDIPTTSEPLTFKELLAGLLVIPIVLLFWIPLKIIDLIGAFFGGFVDRVS
jgi:hypothetical protein